MNIYNNSNDDEITLNIIILVIKDQNVNHLKVLKNFLSYIPNPNHVKALLTKGVKRVINSCPETTRWLWKNPDCLEPEIKVQSIIHQEVSHQILALGISLEEIIFDSEGYLIFPNGFKKELLNRAKSVHLDDNLRLILSLIHDSNLEV